MLENKFPVICFPSSVLTMGCDLELGTPMKEIPNVGTGNLDF